MICAVLKYRIYGTYKLPMLFLFNIFLSRIFLFSLYAYKLIHIFIYIIKYYINNSNDLNDIIITSLGH